MGVEIPQKWDGSGMSFTQSCIVIEELAKVDPAIAVIVDIQNTLINNILMKHGSQLQKEYWLPKLATSTLGAFALSESGSGSDAFAMKTKAERSSDGSYFTINGSKLWISNSLEAGVFLVFANADFSKGYKGITAFIVPKDTNGLIVGKKEDKLGIRASSTCELSLEDCKIPAENMLGEYGKGYKIAIGALNEGRIGIAAQMVGLARGCFDESMRYMRQRKQFGTLISDFQGMKFQYAQAFAEIEAARVLTYNAARLKDSGGDYIRESAIAKLYSSQIAQKVSSLAIDWVGGVGFTKEFAIEKFYRDSKIGTIYEGTSNIQLQTIADMLGKEYSE
jgi:alkylation response protein AidB-like acyl-CoA dehydrogenase